MDQDEIRNSFPITKVNVKTKEGPKPLRFFDHGASTHAPKPVIDKFMSVLETSYANIHRGAHELSIKATDLFEQVPKIIGNFLGFPDLENSGMQPVMTYNTTSSLNLAAHVFRGMEGDILTTVMEHHSNDLPFRRGNTVHHAEILEDGTLDLDDVEEKLQKNNIKLLTVTGASNVTGYLPPVNKLARMAHDNDALILVDAAQRIAHHPIDVKPLDHPEHLDFVAAAGHKFYSPFGAAFLFGNKQIFDEVDPYVPGGGTVDFVSTDDAIFVDGMYRHVYGTPNIAGTIAMGASLEFLTKYSIDYIQKHEDDLMKRMYDGLSQYDEVSFLGEVPLKQRIGVLTFNIDDKYHEDVSIALNDINGIATRNGCFCAHPYVMRLIGEDKIEEEMLKRAIVEGEDPQKPGAVRATIGIYNNEEDVDILIDTVGQIIKS